MKFPSPNRVRRRDRDLLERSAAIALAILMAFLCAAPVECCAQCDGNASPASSAMPSTSSHAILAVDAHPNDAMEHCHRGSASGGQSGLAPDLAGEVFCPAVPYDRTKAIFTDSSKWQLGASPEEAAVSVVADKGLSYKSETPPFMFTSLSRPSFHLQI